MLFASIHHIVTVMLLQVDYSIDCWKKLEFDLADIAVAGGGV